MIIIAAVLVACLLGASMPQERAGIIGDAVKGKELVESNKCLDCHRIGETGSPLGPDLSEIGRLRTPEQLQRSLLAPDAEVLPEHRFVRVVETNDAVSIGRLLNQDAFSIQMIDRDGHLKSYVKSSVREYTILINGLMPSYDGKLTSPQIADIVAYLASLKGAVK